MATQITPPSISQDLTRIHKVITRGIAVTVEKGTEYLRTGFPDPLLRKGYSDYTQSLTIVLEAHHMGEDEVAFPSIREVLPSAPYERLTKNHLEIEAQLKSIHRTIPALAETGEEASLRRLLDTLRRVTAIWRPHIQAEERHFSEEALTAVMSPEEQARVSGLMAKHAQEHSIPASLALPFVLFNLSGEDRNSMAAKFPTMVVEELIPNAWKEQWAPMKPFLLE
jgi:Hemerythrin HHE cation binding domain